MRKRDAFGCCLYRRKQRNVAAIEPGESLNSSLPSAKRGRGRNSAQTFRIEFRTPACPDECDARRPPVARHRGDQEFVEPSAKFLGLLSAHEGAPGGRVEGTQVR